MSGNESGSVGIGVGWKLQDFLLDRLDLTLTDSNCHYIVKNMLYPDLLLTTIDH